MHKDIRFREIEDLPANQEAPVVVPEKIKKVKAVTTNKSKAQKLGTFMISIILKMDQQVEI